MSEFTRTLKKEPNRKQQPSQRVPKERDKQGGIPTLTQSVNPDDYLYLQQTIGNQATLNLLQRRMFPGPLIDEDLSILDSEPESISNNETEQAPESVTDNETEQEPEPGETLATNTENNINQVASSLDGVNIAELTGESELSREQLTGLQNQLVQFGLLSAKTRDAEAPFDLDEEGNEITGNQALSQFPKTLNALESFQAIQTISDDDTDTSDRLEAVKELTQYAREQVATYPDLIDTFIQQPLPTDGEKVATIGKVTAAVARMEWLLGTLYYGGTGKKDTWERVWNEDKGKWKKKTNRGEFADYYRTEKDGSAWCTKFATTVYSKVTGANAIVGSGAKVGWEKRDLNFDESAGGDISGGVVRDATASNSPWFKLRQDVETIHNNDELEATQKTEQTNETVDTFFNDEIKPQAGDILVTKRSQADANQFTKAGREKTSKGDDVGNYKSHTILVERMEGYKLYTVEGNISNRVTGRVFDLTDPTHLAEIILVARPSLKTIDTDYTTPQANTSSNESENANADTQSLDGAVDGANAGGSQVTEEQLLQPIQKLNAILQGLATMKDYIKGNDDTNAPVENLVEHNISPGSGTAH